METMWLLWQLKKEEETFLTADAVGESAEVEAHRGPGETLQGAQGGQGVHGSTCAGAGRGTACREKGRERLSCRAPAPGAVRLAAAAASGGPR